MAKKTQRKASVETGGGAYVAGNVNTGGGDFTGRDREVSIRIGGSVSGSNLVVGDHNIVGGAGDLSVVFAPVYEAIRRSPRPQQDKDDLTAEVQEIEAAVAAPQPDESWLARRLRNLKKMAPDIAEVALAALSGPGAVVSAAVRKIAARAKGEDEQ